MDEREAATTFIAWLAKTKADLGIPATLSALTAKRPVTRADIPALVEVAIHDTCHKTNPRPCAREDFERMFADAI
jgi:alcohol dehydrogenase class IV